MLPHDELHEAPGEGYTIRTEDSIQQDQPPAGAGSVTRITTYPRSIQIAEPLLHVQAGR